MDFDRFKKINDERWNYREMEDASVVSSYRNVGCGDGYRLYLKIDEADRVTDASYTTTGCGFSMTALAFTVELAKGRSLSELENLTIEDIEKEFEFPPRRKNYPQSAIEALRKAIADYREGTGLPPEERVTGKKALAKLAEQGHLRGEKLNSVILEGEKLSGVDFSGADLRNAFLQNCDLSGAIFRETNLRGAYLNDSNLEGADFTGADLRFAKLTGAAIEGAVFTGSLYDIGTRVSPQNLHIFDKMIKKGKTAYIK